MHKRTHQERERLGSRSGVSTKRSQIIEQDEGVFSTTTSNRGGERIKLSRRKVQKQTHREYRKPCPQARRGTFRLQQADAKTRNKPTAEVGGIPLSNHENYQTKPNTSRKCWSFGKLGGLRHRSRGARPALTRRRHTHGVVARRPVPSLRLAAWTQPREREKRPESVRVGDRRHAMLAVGDQTNPNYLGICWTFLKSHALFAKFC